MRTIKCILNPRAGNGKAAKIWPHLAEKFQALGLNFQVEWTRYPGHATEMAQAAIKAGYNEIVAIGGDGTVNEVANGFFEKGKLLAPEAILGMIPRGTGIDLAKSLPGFGSVDRAAETVARGQTRKIDVGLLSCVSRAGKPINRYFLNVADLGYGGALVDRVDGFTKFMGSFLSYFVALLYTLTFYRNEPVSFRIDEGPVEHGVYTAIIAANGAFFGGGMHIAPQAKIDDGQLEFVLIGDLRKVEVIRNLPRLYNGTLHKHKKITYRKGRKLEVWSDREVLLDTDGEMPGKLPARFELLPRCLKVFA